LQYPQIILWKWKELLYLMNLSHSLKTIPIYIQSFALWMFFRHHIYLSNSRFWPKTIRSKNYNITRFKTSNQTYSLSVIDRKWWRNLYMTHLRKNVLR
jgi:hypothetical protein